MGTPQAGLRWCLPHATWAGTLALGFEESGLSASAPRIPVCVGARRAQEESESDRPNGVGLAVGPIWSPISGDRTLCDDPEGQQLWNTEPDEVDRLVGVNGTY
eukprot:6611485-Pyramimonas_sp.AAC.1